MLADLIAASATPTPMPASAHDAYGWWSDIWLPLIVGAGSLGVGAAAVVVAVRSTRAAERSTAAAERSTQAAERSAELAREALDHERKQAEATRQHLAADSRRRFANRVTAAFDDYLDGRVAGADYELAARASERIADLALEAVINDWSELVLHEWSRWSDDFRSQDEETVRLYRGSHRRAIRTMMAAWSDDPKRLSWEAQYWEKALRTHYIDPPDRAEKA